MSVIQLGLRGFQFVLAVVVLGISVSLAKQQTSDDVTIGRVPFAIGLSAAAGALGLVSACFGAVSLFFDAIPTMISLGLDALAGLVFLVGGLIDAVMIGGMSCTDGRKMNSNIVLNPFKKLGDMDYRWLHGRCISFKADTAFMFLSTIACVVIVAASAGSFNKFRRSG